MNIYNFLILGLQTADVIRHQAVGVQGENCRKLLMPQDLNRRFDTGRG